VNRRLTKYLATLCAGVFAAMAAACGGGGGVTPPPTPPSGPYSTSSLNGTYAFVMSGQDGGGFFTRAGSFTANGSGAISGGVQDYNSGIPGGNVTLAITGGSYTIGTNGKGTISLIDSAETIQFSVVLTSSHANGRVGDRQRQLHGAGHIGVFGVSK